MSTFVADEIFNKWRKFMDEIRRTGLGKYLNGKNEFDFVKITPAYNGHLNCSKQFNYLAESNQCVSCSEFSSLHDADNKEVVKVQSGRYTNLELVMEESPRTRQRFGYYREITYDFDKLSKKLAPIKAFQDILKSESKITFFANYDSEISHRLLISELSNYFMFIETNILSCHMCNTTKFIKFHERDNGSIKTKIRTSYDTISIFSQVVIPQCEGMYSSGKVDIHYLNISDNEFIASYDNLRLKFSKMVRIEPNSEAFITSKNYYDKFSKFIGPCKGNIDYETLQFVPVDLHIGTHSEKSNFSGIPTLDKFSQIACVVVKPTQALFDFEEKTGIAPYKHIHVYMWLLCLLCERIFYDNFITAHRDLLNIIFFEDEIQNILIEVTHWHSRKSPTFENLKAMAINLGFSMKFNIYTKMFNYISQVSQKI